MPVVATVSNYCKYKLASGDMDLAYDVLKVILMEPGFVFDKDTHATLSDVTSGQLATGSGYVQDDKSLTGVSLVEDDTNDISVFSCEDPSWTANAGDIGPFGSYIIYDSTSSENIVVGCVEFDGDVTVPESFVLELTGITINIS
jgi:hypothetical protein